MRIPHLFTVASLAGLTIALPTPANPIGREATTGLRRLVVYAQDQFQGPTIEIDAHNRCVKLVAPVYTNLHSYGVVDQVCQFQDDDNCGGNTVVYVDALETEVWDRVDVGGVGGRAARVRSVFCGQLHAAAVKRDVQSGFGEAETAIYDHATSELIVPSKEKVTTLEPRTDTDVSKVTDDSCGGTPCDDPHYTITDYADKPGNVYFCIGHGSGSDIAANCHRSCKQDNAQRSCKTLGPLWVALGDSVYQDRGTICKYFQNDCSDTLPVLVIDSMFFDIPPSRFRDRNVYIISVQCSSNWAAEGEQDAASRIPNYVAKETRRDISVAPPSAPLSSIPGDVHIFTNLNLSGWHDIINALNICYKIPADFAGDKVLMSAPATDRGWESTHIDPVYMITGISCIESDSEQDALDAVDRLPSHGEAYRGNANITFAPLTDKSHLSPRHRSESNSKAEPLQVCHDVNLGGKCFWYAGEPTGYCLNNPFNVDAIESFRLLKGWRCAFFQASDCLATKGPPTYVDSKNGEIVVNDVTYEIWSVTCMPSPY